MNYTYILECNDKSLYTGWTNHLEDRINAHNNGKGAKYTKGKLPVKLVYFETFTTKEEAMRREYEIKQLSRSQKLQLIQSSTNKNIHKGEYTNEEK
ncbi:GIY-YIG nuclease family protein [Anaerosacchariphilus polymeriproducens]|uniref:GIY-YIG nuclease family protein n=1 Tax=Anaerosacchariphilus polymeriproducens TaxID=1812858 RepID=A0A371AWA8_9FIRM|nr:GIY-YIG nuclease family protein [Anaerosacchariphilus polymeriproducens]RDU23865.1 GIY-YIG nuclease family protein [Anaerosacchariphilus polymeriproducens]